MQGHRPQDHLTRQERRAVKVSQHEMSEGKMIVSESWVQTCEHYFDRHSIAASQF